MSKNAAKTPRLEDADLSLHLGRSAYEQALDKQQRLLTQIQQAYLCSGESAVIVFEGWDAAGKGGTIRRISAALDPRGFKVWPIGAPRDYYLQRHFLLRFMERMPPNGALTIFDRSWYGRVLVERVEELTPQKRWKAAYQEINDFERMLADDGTRLVKLFFHVSPEEQLSRFEERLRNPLKRWKLSYEDFRNRSRWNEYEVAINEMFERTSTGYAPWHLIPANDKKHARIAAMSTITERLSRGVDLSPPQLDDTVVEAAKKHMDMSASLIESLAGRTD